MRDSYWFQKKWANLNQEVPIDDMCRRISQLETTIQELQEKYAGALKDIKRLEEENIETTNCLYEIENRLQSKIDNIHPVTYNLTNYSLGDT